MNVSGSDSGNFLQMAGTFNWKWIPAQLFIFPATCSTSLTLSFLAFVHHPHRGHRAFGRICLFTYLLGIILNAFHILSNITSITLIYYPLWAGEEEEVISPKTHG